MIVPVTVDDEALIVVHQKINRKLGNTSVADVRKAASDLIERYVNYELMEELYEEFE